MRKRLVVLSCASLVASAAFAETKMQGAIDCDKAEPRHAIPVPDREGFAYSISQHRCSWPKPIAIKGAKTMEYVSTGSTEVMGPSITTTSQGITTYDNGDKGFTRATGKVDGKAGTNTGKWTFIGGTGHLSGIKGGGTFVCKLKGPEPGAGFACDIKGRYTLPLAK